MPPQTLNVPCVHDLLEWRAGDFARSGRTSMRTYLVVNARTEFRCVNAVLKWLKGMLAR
jgi:hypothetical protein